MEKKRILTIKEAAALIDGLTEYRVRQMCITGQLPCFKAGRKYLISEENLMNVVFGDKYPVANDVVKKQKSVI